MKEKSKFKKMMSFVWENIEEEVSTDHHPRLEVAFTNGKYMLNGSKVNHSFGLLDDVFRQAFALIPLEKRGHQEVLLLGLGAGNVPTLLQEYADQYGHSYAITGVEIDPKVVELGKKYFGLAAHANLEIVIADAVQFISTTERTFDLVIIDLYIEDQVPLGMETRKAITQLAKLLKPGGMLLYNRLMLNPMLTKQTLAFQEMVKTVLPEAYHYDVSKNRMLVYEKVDREDRREELGKW